MAILSKDPSRENFCLDNEKLWKAEDVANLLCLNPNTIRSMSRAGKLPAIKVGRVWRYKKEHIEVWLENSKNDKHF